MTLHSTSGEVAEVTGELFIGRRTAAVLVVDPAISVFQMSFANSQYLDFI